MKSDLYRILQLSTRVSAFILVLILGMGCLLAQDASEGLAEESFARAIFRDQSYSADERAADLLSHMTLEEKIGQMTLVERTFLQSPRHIAFYHLGALLSGGGSSPRPNTSESWANMTEGFQDIALSTRLAIPLLYGSDAVHGHGNLYGATIFPHHIGMGATNDPDLVRRLAEITAVEIFAGGVNWNYSPAISVPQDIRWGRTYEGFSEDPAIVGILGAAEVEGLQNSKLPVIATAKHYAGDGGTRGGRDRGNTVVNADELERIHLAPYHNAIEADVAVIMASYSSLNSVKMHGHRELMTDHLKGELGFEGFIVSDWDALEELGGSLVDQVSMAINAGIDMVMVPDEYIEFIAALSSAIEDGRVSTERIDDAVRRILRVKFKYGIFDNPMARRDLTGKVGSAEHRSIAREAVAKSLVLLKNEESALPFSATTRRILVVGSMANDIGAQSGGWTIEWQGRRGDITEGTTILEAVRERGREAQVDYAPYPGDLEKLDGTEYDAVVVVIGEDPYAEGVGDSPFPAIDTPDAQLGRAVRERFASAAVITIILSGRPLIMDTTVEDSDALVAAWLPGTEGGGIADVLWNDRPFTGTLPYDWPVDTGSLRGIGEHFSHFYPSTRFRIVVPITIGPSIVIDLINIHRPITGEEHIERNVYTRLYRSR